ncbi:plectin-like [Brienomyrus brachyistius]|uniref:plectin-like n=1 Tax=Brienomyrus brachyistius TaxID=42636 RepID=UPI0020B44415|nr:plectin-like [Brienomyrus brachyistius]
MTDESTFRFDLPFGTLVQREDVAEGGSLRMENAQSVDHVDDGYNTKTFSLEGESTGCHSDIMDELLGDVELVSTDGTLDGFPLSLESLVGEARLSLQLHMETPGKREAEPEKRLEARGQTADLEIQEECKRDLKETIQLCEVLMSEKAAVVAECDFIARKLRALQEENQTLRQEKEHLLKDIEERREMEEFRALEQESTRQSEKELLEEIASLKKAADASGAHVQNLEMDLAAMVAELKRKEDSITELQALRHKDSAQEIRQLKRSLQDAETLSRDTRKEWAVLRSEAQALRESEFTMAEAHAKMEEEVRSLNGRLEVERRRFKEMEADLLKELQRTFQENDRLMAMQAATCPKDVEVGLRAELELSQERERALQARVAELELSQERETALQARVAEMELSQERERALQARVAEMELSQEMGRALQARVAELELSQERERALQARVAELEWSQERVVTNQAKEAELELFQVEQSRKNNSLGDHHVPSRRSEELNEENEQVTHTQQVPNQQGRVWKKEQDELQGRTQQVAEELEEVRKKSGGLRDAGQWLDDNGEEEELRKSDADRSLRQQSCGQEASQLQIQEMRITGLEEALAKAEHSVAVHKEATQLLQTELQDVYAQVSERDDAIQALQCRLEEYEFNSMMELQRKDTTFRGDPKGVVLSAWNREDVEPIEEPLQKVKETCRTPVHSDQSVVIDSGMSRNMLDATRGCSFQSPLMDKEAMRQLKNAHPESKVTSHQEAVKWRRRATQLKENRRDTHPPRLQSPHTPTRGRRLVAASDGRMFDSPKSKFFDTHSEGVRLDRPRQFFDNSSLGAVSDVSLSLEHWNGTMQPSSPRQDDNCKAQ